MEEIEGNEFSDVSQDLKVENMRLRGEISGLEEQVKQENFRRKVAESRQNVKVYKRANETFLERKLVPVVGDGGARAVVAFYLGSLFGGGLCLYFLSSSHYSLGLYMVLVGVFHMWEYIYVSIFRPSELRIEHFIVDHGLPFVIAYFVTYAEYLLEAWLFPWMKGYRIIVYTGLIVCIIGQVIRTVAMFQCGTNFNHLIEYGKKRDDHVLVTRGLYNYFRHPSYFGWFYWSIFSQVVLMNPICVVGFSFVSWKFFNFRIHSEELELLKQFGKQYSEYRKRVGVHIPFINTE